MPFCPRCKAEYRADFTECADCQVPLVAELPVEEPTDEFFCDHCDTKVENTTTRCPCCGFILDADIPCPDHPDMPALAHCIICDRILCEEDIQEKGIYALCDEHAGLEIIEDHVLLIATTDEIKAGLVEEVLRNANLHPVANGQDRGLGKCYAAVNLYYFQVLVPLPEYLPAVKLIERALKEIETPLEDDEA